MDATPDTAPCIDRVPNVCPRCANRLPVCVDRKPDGTRYTHAETCATYDWADDFCGSCVAEMAEDEA